MGYQATGTESVSGLRQAVSERLAAHRRRRTGGTAEQAGPPPVTAKAGASRVREAVAARYQNSVTYREFLAQAAESALEQAQAEAEMATRKAQAVAEAQMQLLEELEQWKQGSPGPREVALAEHRAEIRDTLAHAVADIAVAATELMEQQPLPGIPLLDEPVVRSPRQGVERRPATEGSTAGLTVRLYEDFSSPRPPVERARRVSAPVENEDHEHTTLDEEIAFRRAPEFDVQQVQPVGIAGNLIEFPRQLIAARRARPRLAEGPLRDEGQAEPQLRIFEVEAEQISIAPADAGGAPEWQGILLESASAAVSAPVPRVEGAYHFTTPPQTARLGLRVMAAAVDGCCIGAGMVAFALVVVEVAGRGLKALPLPLLGASAAGVALTLFVLYHLLFFTLSEATPGMCYARIGLCTFADANPTRSAMRRRVLATLLAACPLGIGLAWAWLDEDRLGWQDRISRMYQRAY